MIPIILAAGSGGRLKPLTDKVPKCLLKVDNHAILDWQLDTLQHFKPEKIIIVTGYKTTEVEVFITNNYPRLPIKIVRNKNYATTNNGVSLNLALEEVPVNKKALIINGDIVFHKDVIKDMYRCKDQNAISVIYNSCNEEDMKVYVNNGRITKLNKEFYSGENPVGQALGIYKISNVADLKRELSLLNKSDYFNDAIENMLSYSSFGLVNVSNYPAMEIDFQADLNYANEYFRWGKPEWEQGVRHGANLNEVNALKLLDDVDRIFKKYNISTFFIFGLALGAYRDNKFIPWDTDLDLGAYLEDREKVLLAEKELYDLNIFIPNETNFYYDRWYIRDGEKIELHFFDKLGNNRVYDIFRCNFSFPAYMIDKLDTIQFYQREFKIPSDTEKFLELSYGLNWKTPIKSQKTIQFANSGSSTETKTVIVSGIFNPFKIEDINKLDEIKNRGNIIVLVHSDEYLLKRNVYPISLSADSRRHLMRNIKGVEDAYIANDANDCVSKDLEYLKANIWIDLDNNYHPNDLDFCRKRNIQIGL